MTVAVHEPLGTGARERLIQVACGIGVLFQTVTFYVLLPLTGYLLTRPLLGSLLRPGNAVSLVTGGAYARVGMDPLWAVVLVGTLGLMLLAPLRWWAGARYGDRVLGLLLGQNEKLLLRLERFTARWGTWVLVFVWFTPIPLLFVQLAVATAGVSLKRFLAADLLGTLLWVGLTVGLGYGIGKPAVHTVKVIGHYALLVTIAVIVIAVVVSVVRGVRLYRTMSAAEAEKSLSQSGE